jgi:hypothetical protein
MPASEVIRQVKLQRWAAGITEIVIDPWAAKSHPFGNDSPQEVWQKAFPHARVRCEIRASVEDGIQATCDWLMGPDGNSPRLFVDELKCERTVWEFDHWRRRKLTGKAEDINCDATKAIAAGILHRNLDRYHSHHGRAHDYDVASLREIMGTKERGLEAYEVAR